MTYLGKKSPSLALEEENTYSRQSGIQQNNMQGSTHVSGFSKAGQSVLHTEQLLHPISPQNEK